MRQVPSFIVDLFFEDSSYLLNYLKFTGGELYDGIAALNFAYQMGWITSNISKPDILPQEFDLGNYAKAPINVSHYLPSLPVELFPGLWKGRPVMKAGLWECLLINAHLRHAQVSTVETQRKNSSRRRLCLPLHSTSWPITRTG